MFEIIPIVLWACVALFVWWLCGIIAVVLNYIFSSLHQDGEPTKSDKRVDMVLGPIAIFLLLCLIIGTSVGPLGARIGSWIGKCLTGVKGF